MRPAAGGSAGLIAAFDPVSCTLRAVLDSADITAARTGAIAAVAHRSPPRFRAPAWPAPHGVLEGAELVADVPANAAEVGNWPTCPADPARPGALRSANCSQAVGGLAAGQRVVFDSVGTAVADAAAVALVLATAEAEQAGTLVDFAR